MEAASLRERFGAGSATAEAAAGDFSEATAAVLVLSFLLLRACMSMQGTHRGTRVEVGQIRTGPGTFRNLLERCLTMRTHSGVAFGEQSLPTSFANLASLQDEVWL